MRRFSPTKCKVIQEPRQRRRGRGDAPCADTGAALAPAQGCHGSPGATITMNKKGTEKARVSGQATKSARAPNGMFNQPQRHGLIRPRRRSATFPGGEGLGGHGASTAFRQKKTARRPFFPMRKRAINNSPRGSRSSSGDARRRGRLRGLRRPSQGDRSCGIPTS